MNILLLEDRGSRLYDLMIFLQEKDHKVYPCANIYNAKETWKKYGMNSGARDRIDCIIVDLAMNPDGLRDQEASQSGYYSGWVFLKEYVLISNPEFAERCIILSAWSDSFKKYLVSDEVRGGIREENVVSKDDQDFYKTLIKVLKNIKNLSLEMSKTPEKWAHKKGGGLKSEEKA